MAPQSRTVKIAFFLATSGHSGVDRSMAYLLPELCKRGYYVDLLRVRNHGPYIDIDSPKFSSIDLARAHTMTSLGPLVRYLKTEQPDVLFADKDRANRIALLAKLITGVNTKVVVSSGTIMSINLKNRSLLEVFLHKLSMNYLYPKSHSVIVPSIDAAEDLANVCKLTRNDITVVPLPIVNEDVVLRSQDEVDHPWFRDKQVPIIIAVGELSPRKDHATLIKSFAKVRRHLDSRLVIIGKGHCQEELEKLIESLDLQSSVQLLGYQTNPYCYIARSDLFVHSARFEGFGMVLVESLFLGIPVVATDCMGGPKEILKNGEYGQLVPVGNDSAMANAILEVLSNDKAYNFSSAVAPYTVVESTNAYLDSMSLSHKADK